jgi:hypothetical protein
MKTATLGLVLLASGCAGAFRAKGQAPADAGAEPQLANLVELARSGPDLAQYPQADAVVALNHEDVRLEKDGRVVTRHHFIVRIIDAQRGKEKFADLHIPFDSNRQTLTIRTARTINPDGTVHVAGKEEITDILPPELVGATMYSGLLHRVVSFPAVDRGSVIDLDFERVSRADADNPMGAVFPLEAWNPQILRQVTISAPVGQMVHLAVEGMKLAPSEDEDGPAVPATDRRHRWTFTLANTPDRHPEADSPQDDVYSARLLLSFLPDWRAAHARIAGRYLDVVLPRTPAPAVKAKAAALVVGARTPYDRAQRLFKFVAHDIRSINLSLGEAGYTPNPPQAVLAQRYGDGRDKVGLLIALCAAEGITAVPVFTREGGVPVVPGVPTVGQFDRIVARIVVPGHDKGDIWVDTSQQYCHLGQ